jgi:mRNA interferase HicA
MKRRDLERKLRIAGCYLKREGSAHALWINPKKILKNMNAE